MNWFWRIPAGVWLFLAITQFLTFVDRTIGIPGQEAAIAELTKQGFKGKPTISFVITLREMEWQRNCAAVLAPIFLALAKIKFSKAQRSPQSQGVPATTSHEYTTPRAAGPSG
jgi:hypothetical protein